MQAIEPEVEGFMENFLIQPEDIWQPTDFLPDPQSDGFLDHVEQLREESKELGYDFTQIEEGKRFIDYLAFLKKNDAKD